MKSTRSYHRNRKAQWWIPNVKRKKQRTMIEDLHVLLKNISMHCYSRLVEQETGFWEKFMWFIIHVIAFVALVFVLQYAINEFISKYIGIVIHDPIYPIQNVAFPAVSICSNNRISNKAAQEYAYHLSQKDPQHKNASFFLESIKTFNLLYSTSSIFTNSDNMDFQRFLDTFDTNDEEMFFNTSRIMLFLTPKCEDLILNCSLNGKPYDNCFDDDMFKMSLTQYGYCCTFNGNNQLESRNSNNRLFGPDLGLTITLNSSEVDDFQSIFSVDGFVVLIYAPYKYPDMTSSGVSERFVTSGFETFLAVTAKPVDSDSSIKPFVDSMQLCHFPNYEPHIYDNNYSFNLCVTRCRMRSIVVLCKCVPYFMPASLLGNSVETVICTLRHVECLDRYLFKWLNVITKRDEQDVEGLEREMEDALYCPECLPSCVDIQYQMSLMTLPIERYLTSPTNNIVVNDTQSGDLSDVSLVRIYFALPSAKLHRYIIQNNWGAIFSTVGGLSGIVIGFSICSFCELVYFIVKHSIQTFVTAAQIRRNSLTIAEKEKKLIILP